MDRKGRARKIGKKKGKGRVWAKEPHIRYFSTLDTKDHTIQMCFNGSLAWERRGEGRQGGREYPCIFT